ncbi:MAG: hypothetical protein JO276_00380 [Sphingomonadaceae bacterium]|nr:hypothetical protein [Sphingomonadaceae bacterium]
MPFSYNAVWEDTVKLLRQHAPLLAAVAGVFMFLPALLFAVLMPPPQPQGDDPARMFELIMAFYRQAAPWFLVQGLFSIVGTLAMLRLVFAPGRTVGDALVQALKLTPFYILLSILFGLAVGIAGMLILVPAALIGPIAVLLVILLLFAPILYLIGRIAPVPAVMVAENRRNPIDAIRRTFALTAGHGWAIIGLIVVIAVVAVVAVGMADTLAGLVFILAAGQEIGKLLASVVASALNAAFATLLVMLYAAIYRALAGTDSIAATFE